MGTTFPLIADEALDVCDEKDFSCHLCDREDVAHYRYPVTIIRNEEEDALDYLCASCILENEFERRDREWDSSLARCHDRSLSLRELQKTPDLPCFIQGIDWPVCCGRLCEFIGVPQSEEIRSTLHLVMAYWDDGFTDYNQRYDSSPESEFPEDIGMFRCRDCQKEVFTFQCM